MKKLIEFIVTTTLLFALMVYMMSQDAHFMEWVADVLWYMDLDQYLIAILFTMSAVIACVGITLGNIVGELLVDMVNMIKWVFHKIRKAA